MFIRKKSVSVVAQIFGSLSLATASSLVVAQEAQPTQPLQRVEITGSSVKRVDAETALPVQVLTKQDIARTGATSTQELLASISSLSSSGQTLGATGAGTTTYGVSSISLRGLSDERTLVLVNGRRLAAFAGGGGATVNVNAIPLAAIERIEVLKDGASGVYGSDAIAGVVNFILSRSFTGVEVSAGYGTPTASGGGQNAKASVTAGFGDLATSGFSAVVSASVERDKILFGKDRDFSKSATFEPFYASGATGQGNIEGGYIPGAFPNDRVPGLFGNSPGTGFGNPLAAQDKCADIQMVKSSTPTSNGAPYCVFDTGPFVGLLPKRDLVNLTGNFTFKLNANTEVFADALYSKSTVTQIFQPSPVRRSFLLTDGEFQKQKIDPALILYPDNPAYKSIAAPYLQSQGFNDLIGKPLAITSRVFDFGGRTNKDESTQSRIVVGVKGNIAGQDYEVAYSSNQSKLTGTVPDGYFSQATYAKIINDPANNWNPWAPNGVQVGPLAEKLQAAKYSGSTLDAKSKSDVLDGKISGELFKMPEGAAQYAAGFQSRRESYVTRPSPALETGDIAGLGGSQPPVDRSRTINSVFGEINVPVLKGLEGNLALRHDRYNDVGNSTNYKASARWQPNSAVLLRASLGSGFRAPTLTDLWKPQITGTSEQFDDPATGQTDLQVNAISGGNPNLKPEKSKQRSIGLVISPTGNLSFGVDLFRLNVTDILATPSAQEVVSRFRAGDPAYAGLVDLNGKEIDLIRTILANTGTAKVSGADVFASFRQNLDFARLDINLNGTYMNKFNQTSPGGALSRKVGTLVEPDGTPVLGADKGGVILRWKHALSVSLTQGPWTGTLVQNYSSGYRAGDRLDGEPNYIGSQSLFDANVQYKGIKDLTLGLGVKNVFNTKPAVFTPVSNQFQAGYDVTQYDPRGRFVYVNAIYQFK
ncbi:MAG: TonB-dependent receptor [Burkholderiaceae bacterium]|nr:TonB-dependent receptor [Burkholderiaceae bacterium]